MTCFLFLTRCCFTIHNPQGNFKRTTANLDLLSPSNQKNIHQHQTSVPFWIFPSWDIPTLGCHAIQCHLRIWGSAVRVGKVHYWYTCISTGWRDEKIKQHRSNDGFRKLLVSIWFLCKGKKTGKLKWIYPDPHSRVWKQGWELGLLVLVSLCLKNLEEHLSVDSKIQWIPHVPNIETEIGQTDSFKSACLFHLPSTDLHPPKIPWLCMLNLMPFPKTRSVPTIHFEGPFTI